MMDYTMNSELCRLRTYSTWTSTAVSPILLAMSGFFYSGKNDEVICFACETRLSGWNANDNPLERHKQSAPNCPFVRGDPTGNITLKINHSDRIYQRSHATTENAELEVDLAVLQDNRLDDLTKLYYLTMDRARKKGLLSSDNDIQLDRSVPDFVKLRLEEERLLTFQNWPPSARADPGALARAGLFYTGTADRVQCAFCRGVMMNWVSSDIPEAEHKRHYPDCQFVRGLGVLNVPLVKNSEAAAPKTTNQCDGQPSANENLVREAVPARAPGQIQSLAVPMSTNAKYPDYADVTKRIQSFKKGIVSRGQTAERLADAGWFFIGPGDKVCCFQCGGNLKDWEPEDDPWEEHKKWYPSCNYIRNHTRSSGTQIQQAAQGAARVYRPEPSEVEARMDTPTVRAILGMGFTRDSVRMAIENRLSTAGDDFPNAESLLEALFQLEEDGTQTQRSAIAVASSYFTDTLGKTSGNNSTTSNSTVPSSQGSVSNHQPGSASVPPSGSGSSTHTAASSQSMIPASQENLGASATVAVATGDEIVANGLSKAKGSDDKVCCPQCGGNLREREPDDGPCDEHKKLCRKCGVSKSHRERVSKLSQLHRLLLGFTKSMVKEKSMLD